MTFPPELVAPARLRSRAEVLASPSPVPREPGVFAWYFRDIPPGVPIADCHRCGDLTLFSIGIAAKAPPKNGARPSTQRLVDRVRYPTRVMPRARPCGSRSGVGSRRCSALNCGGSGAVNG